MIQKSIALAEELQSKIEQNLSASERQFHAKMQKLLNNPKNKVMLIELLDRSFRCKDKKASFELIEHTLNKFGKSEELELFFGIKFSDDKTGEFGKILSKNTPKSVDIKA